MATTKQDKLPPLQRLCKADFISIRSLSRGQWIQGQQIEWRFNRQWRFVNFDQAPALCAADRLMALGLVEQSVCCTGCNREVFQLTESGRVFARRIDGLEVPGCVAKAQQVEATVPKLGDWFFRHLPKVWGRWWSARLLATSTCAVWLHSENPEFTNWQRHKRNALCLALFLVPVRLPIAIHAETKSVHFRG